jgi:Ras GTPase-activating-like protein IQGAP2/3/Ras GTPase-activating-like protein IQGAP1
LISKRKYYEEQREFYERYISDCLAKQAIDDKQAKAKSAKGGSFRLKSRKEKKEVKYSADQLIKKGVLLSLDGDEVKNTKHLKVTFL